MKEIYEILLNMYEKSILEFQNNEKRLNIIVPGMTANDEKYLEILTAMENPTFSEFAIVSKITKPAATQIVKRLIDKGYIEKIQSEEDKRIFYLKTTNIINEYFDECEIIFCELLSKWFSVLRNEEVDLLKELLSKVNRNI